MLATRLLDALAATDARTRQLALVLAVIVVVVATIALTLDANASLASARENVQRQRMMLDVVRVRTKESALLERTSAPVRAALDDVVDKTLREHAVTYRRTRDTSQGDAESIVVDAVPFDVLVRALDALARDHGVRPIETNIAARVDAGSVRAELTLAR